MRFGIPPRFKPQCTGVAAQKGNERIPMCHLTASFPFPCPFLFFSLSLKQWLFLCVCLTYVPTPTSTHASIHLCAFAFVMYTRTHTHKQTFVAFQCLSTTTPHIRTIHTFVSIYAILEVTLHAPHQRPCPQNNLRSPSPNSSFLAALPANPSQGC